MIKPTYQLQVGKFSGCEAFADVYLPMSVYPMLDISEISCLMKSYEILWVADSELQAFSAAFGTSSSAPMFHIVGLTPEDRLDLAGIGIPRVFQSSDTSELKSWQDRFNQ